MITSLRLQNFRCYQDGSFEFENGVNIVVGPNACGKTSLLEAVLVLARGSSYRAKDAELIQFGSDWARLDGYFNKQSRSVVLKLIGDSAEKSLAIDEQKYIRLSSEKRVPIVVFEPNDLQLLIKGPESRREYIDNLLEQTTPGFKTIKNNYKRSVAQRNSLLKMPRVTKDQLFVWNVRISELGGKIVELRTALIEELNQNFSATYSEIVNKNTPLIAQYNSKINLSGYSSLLLNKLEAGSELDKQRGFTSYGPHRDDIAFLLNDENAAVSASRGETRTILIALKIFELAKLEAFYDQKPILLLDDVFSELDGSRRSYLVEYLKGNQTIITTTDADAVIKHFSTGYNLMALG